MPPARTVLAALAVLGAAIPGSPPAAGGEPPAPEKSLEAELRPRAEAAVRDGKLADFRAEVGGRLAKMLAEPEALAKRAAELEVLEHYRNVGGVFDFKADEETRALLVWLVGQREFCSRFCHALDSSDRAPGAVGVLRRLKSLKGVEEARYLQNYELAIAMAIVWDDYRWLPWCNLTVADGRMEEIYDYYLTRGPGLPGRPLSLPHELLRYVVDHPLTKEEREYALTTYGGRGSDTLGSVFFDIPWSDKPESLAFGKNQSVPYTLLNIRKLHGVCLEQAYHASCVAKCLGVPAVLCRGLGTRGSHAWVGVLTADGWNLSAGRYAYDHYWTGEVADPTCRTRMLSDGEVAMSGGVLKRPKSQLESAEARRRMAFDVWTGALAGAADGAGAPDPAAQPKPATLDAAGRKLVFELLFSSLKLDPYSRRSWELAGAAAAAGTFSRGELQQLSDHLFRQVGSASPDFVCRTVQLLVAAVPERKDRDELYETCFQYFRGRPDLASSILVARGRTWESEGRTEEAVRAYSEAVTLFPRDGHVTRQAAASLEAILAKGETASAAETLRGVWNSMHASLGGAPPQEKETLRIIGEALIKYARAAGMKKEVERFEPIFRKTFPEPAKKE